MSVETNRYAPPAAKVADVVSVGSDAEEIRSEHIKHEASVRSVGVLYYIGGVMMLVTIAVLAWLFISDNQAAGAPMPFGVIFAIYAVFAAVSFALGYGVRKLASWVRIPAIIVSCIGLLGFPVGTLINGYILYLLLSEKGRRIFEPDYAEIVAATPHIKYKTSIVVWILLAILILGIGAAIVIPMLAG